MSGDAGLQPVAYFSGADEGRGGGRGDARAEVGQDGSSGTLP
ncbi:hypothetical protein ABZ154_11460 [Streptomyces sp. NPDC006261]